MGPGQAQPELHGAAGQHVNMTNNLVYDQTPAELQTLPAASAGLSVYWLANVSLLWGYAKMVNMVNIGMLACSSQRSASQSGLNGCRLSGCFTKKTPEPEPEPELTPEIQRLLAHGGTMLVEIQLVVHFTPVCRTTNTTCNCCWNSSTTTTTTTTTTTRVSLSWPLTWQAGHSHMKQPKVSDKSFVVISSFVQRTTSWSLRTVLITRL